MGGRPNSVEKWCSCSNRAIGVDMRRIHLCQFRNIYQNCCLLPDGRFRRCRQIYWSPTNFFISFTAVEARVRPKESHSMAIDEPTMSTARFFTRSNTDGWMTSGTRRRISRRFLKWRRRAIEWTRDAIRVLLLDSWTFFFFFKPVFWLVCWFKGPPAE